MNETEHRAIDKNFLNGNPFPVNINFSLKDNFYSVHLTPMSISEIFEFIPQNTFLIFDVDYEVLKLRLMNLSDVVEKYSSYLKKFCDETLLIDKKSLRKLLDEISHHNFCLIDAETDIDVTEVSQIVRCADRSNELTVIREVGRNFFLSSHDDCYLYFETNDEDLSRELISRQIKTLVSTGVKCPLDTLKFNSDDLITRNEFSIMIFQNPVKTQKEVRWKIFDGTFRELFDGNEPLQSNSELVYFENTREIKIEKDPESPKETPNQFKSKTEN